jgi:hypothetical protein
MGEQLAFLGRAVANVSELGVGVAQTGLTFGPPAALKAVIAAVTRQPKQWPTPSFPDPRRPGRRAKLI